MRFVEILLLAFALAADAFTVATSVGLRHSGPRQLFRLSFHFGLFQSLFALIGALAGTLFLGYMRDYDHWVAFTLLVLVGLHMIYAAWRGDAEKLAQTDLTRGLSLVGLSAAVSMDALAAGVGLPAAGGPYALAVVMIGLVSALATLLAMLLAGRVQQWTGARLEVAAGVVLIGLGGWVLFSHLTAVA
jgi:manganese efflux pump family protein